MTIIAILDDEPYGRARIRSLIEKNLPDSIEATILEASSPTELAVLTTRTQIDILVADIVMPDGQPSGIDIVDRLFPESSGTQVIYASGYLRQAPEVYRTPHVYFLLKPIDPEKMRDALARACAALQKARPIMLRIKSGHRDRLINVATISYIESSLHKAIVHCRTGNFETYARLDDLQQQLPASFSRCHRSFLVNLAYVASLEDSDIRMHDGTVIPVSRRRSRQVQHDLLGYISSRG